jgi:hypothetical protein
MVSSLRYGPIPTLDCQSASNLITAQERRAIGSSPKVLTALIDFEEGRAYSWKVKVREIIRMLEDDSWLLVRTREALTNTSIPRSQGFSHRSRGDLRYIHSAFCGHTVR